MKHISGHWQLIVITMAVFALWQTPVLMPLKIFTVFLHEFGHAAMTLLTGGDVISLSVSAQQGGEVWSAGGNRFLILTAGYLGSLVFGVALLLSALWWTADRIVMAFCGAVMLLVALMYVRDIFAIAFTAGTGIAMIATAWFLPNVISDLVLRILGLTSMIYVPYDIFSDTIQRAQLRSDARMLAEEFGGTTMIWGGLWLVISLAVIFQCLRKGLGTQSNIDWRTRP